MMVPIFLPTGGGAPLRPIDIITALICAVFVFCCILVVAQWLTSEGVPLFTIIKKDVLWLLSKRIW